ncbi:AAA family ATPase [Sediminibacillus halophilus]|uniref:Wobble nucleotide-excising tRNase n=1 Tax=Sediminibacillus halophilus TaxID=482461 RepID=A0A1G9UWG7_9BACI|nr:AAA family ATPase [Sediminibacillus halophilus]SDM64179.1 Wobble nucleotide-excising tRNase [Sediminibacillus halophilus]
MDFSEIKAIKNITWRGCVNFDFNLFEQGNQQEKSRRILCYGHNGSGKSSVGEAISHLKLASEGIDSVTADNIKLDIIGEGIVGIHEYSNNKNMKNIRVFNERFIKKNIDISEDEDLNAIIMFGKDVENETRREDIEKNIESINIKKEELDIKKKENEDRVKEIIDKSFEKEFIKPIRELGRNRNHTTAIRDYILTSRIDNHELAKENIQQDISYLNSLKQLRTSNKIPIQISKLPVLLFYDEIVLKKIEKPQLSAKEEAIINLIKSESGYTNWVETGKNLIKKTVDDCPLCLQPINKDILLSKIDEIINPSVKNFKKELDDELTKINNYDESLKKIEDQSNDIKQYFQVRDDLIPCVTSLIENINSILINTNELRSTIMERYENVYNELEPKSISVLLDNIHKFEKESLKNIEEIENIRLSYNESIDHSENKIKEFKNVIETKVFNLGANAIESYQKDLKNINAKYKENDNLLRKLKTELQSVEQELKNSTHGMNLINKDLSFIFLTENRLQLQPDSKDGYKYNVLVKGEPVKSSNLSTGERNALALVYYFKSLYSNHIVEETLKNSMFLVLDDPISSMDENNLMGLISYINSEINNILISSPKSRVLIMTHRWYVFDSLHKLFDGDSNGVVSFELIKNGQTMQQNFINLNNFKHKNGYKNLLSKLYSYGKKIIPPESVSIGNTARRVLEAYFTFNYRVGINSINNQREIFDRIKGNNQFKEKFMKTAIRLILNSESHLEDEMYQIGQEFTDNTFTDLEKQMTCQHILGLLYLLDDFHLKKYLQNNDENWETIENTIKSWINIA